MPQITSFYPCRKCVGCHRRERSVLYEWARIVTFVIWIMLSNSEETSDDCILYELLVYSEWKQDPELLVTGFTACVTLKLRLGLCQRLMLWVKRKRLYCLQSVRRSLWRNFLLLINILEVFDLMENVTGLKAIILAHWGIPGSKIA